jgi:hypothetical protein
MVWIDHTDFAARPVLRMRQQTAQRIIAAAESDLSTARIEDLICELSARMAKVATPVRILNALDDIAVHYFKG